MSNPLKFLPAVFGGFVHAKPNPQLSYYVQIVLQMSQVMTVFMFKRHLEVEINEFDDEAGLVAQLTTLHFASCTCKYYKRGDDFHALEIDFAKKNTAGPSEASKKRSLNAEEEAGPSNKQAKTDQKEP
jgi:hypothetical protein